VRWFGHDTDYKAGWDHRRLEWVGYLDDVDQQFGFISPRDVVRGCHLIPAFAHGQTDERLGLSAYQLDKGDYTYYYVNRRVSARVCVESLNPSNASSVSARFVDHDMVLWYTDLRIGHLSKRQSDPKERIDYAGGDLAPEPHHAAQQQLQLEEDRLDISAEDLDEEDLQEVDLDEGKTSDPDVDSEEE
jgi:hypothetical protein